MSKQSLHYRLIEFCQKNGFTLVQEYRFNPTRKFRSDYYIPELNLLVEFEGMGGSHKAGIGGHQTLTGYSNNCIKYNSACLMGFKLLRYTTKTTKYLLSDFESLTKID